MSEVKRYRMTLGGDWDEPYPDVEEHNNGTWVAHSDYATLAARVEELEGLLRRHGSHEDHCNTIMGWEKPYRPPLQCDCVLAEFMSPLEVDDG
jgi:hypothetical protein